MKFSKKVLGSGSKAFVFYHFWYGNSRIYFSYRGLAKHGTCIFYDYSPDILSSDIKLTAKNFQEIINDGLNEIQKFDEASVFGSSLGSTLAWMLAKKSKKVKNIVLNTLGDNFAETLWYGSATQHIRKELVEQKVSLEELKNSWKALSPDSNMRYLKNRSYLVFTAEKDKVIPYSQQLAFVKELKKISEVSVVKNNNLPHSTAVLKNIFDVKRVKTFMLK